MPSTDPTDRQRRNSRWLTAYGHSRDPHQRISWRNALVAANLPLVHSVASRQSRACQLPFDDLLQVGSIGLIKAVEAFDPTRRVRLSSFAVPYILGAMRREQRDREPMVRIPRQLWDLRQQAAGLQERRRGLGLEPLGEAALAGALGCARELLQEAFAMEAAGAVRSLDGKPAGGSDGEGLSLLDRLAAPAGNGNGAPPGEEESQRSGEASAELVWLRGVLEHLEPLERELLDGRLRVGCTWVELGAQLGLAPRQAQRRCTAVLERLRRAAAVWRAESIASGSDPLPRQARAGAAPEPCPWAPRSQGRGNTAEHPAVGIPASG